MAQIINVVQTNETSYQINFYKTLFGENYQDYVTIDRSTDGYTKGIIFEHKQNVTSYGLSKTLSQALIYLARFNRDGVPVPAKICLVSQDEGKCFVFKTENYMKYVEDIESYANLKGSDGIPNFSAGAVSQIIEFDKNLSNLRAMKNISNFVEMAPETVKIHINVHNVYGWSGYYYSNAGKNGNKQKPEKKAFFSELRNPTGLLKAYIHPWTGEEADFKYIMDMLNDPMTQKKLGAFYTPPQYAELAAGLVKDAVQRAIDAGKKDYIILDRCAGTGNLEMYLDDEMLSHTIVSTYELKEWMVLKDRFGGRVRYIIPPIPKEKDTLPELNEAGFLSGANALSRDIIDNEEIRKYLDDPECAIILYENPPYAETTSIEFQKQGKGKESSTWKSDFIVQELKKEVSGAASNDMANAFIWSAFKYFLRQPSDSYVVFSPVKYWKSQHIVEKKFIDGYAFNRKHFHAPTDACIMCAYWSNEDDTATKSFNLKAKNIVNNSVADEGSVKVKKVFKMFSDDYFEGNRDTDVNEGILCDLDGTDSETDGKSPKARMVKKISNNSKDDRIVGYLAVDSFGLDNPRLHSCLTVATKYNGNGFYLREDNFVEKLPLFAAARYPDYCNDWKVMSLIMKTADKSNEYKKAVQDGSLNAFLFKVLLWTSISHYPHMRSLNGSDGKLYLNQLCLDGQTIANQKLQEFIASGYVMTNEEKVLIDQMKEILKMIKTCDEYNKDFNYGLYQIDEEINISVKIGENSDGTEKKGPKYGDLNQKIKDFKKLAKDYYISNLVDTLFEYEFLK